MRPPRPSPTLPEAVLTLVKLFTLFGVFGWEGEELFEGWPRAVEVLVELVDQARVWARVGHQLGQEGLELGEPVHWRLSVVLTTPPRSFVQSDSFWPVSPLSPGRPSASPEGPTRPAPEKQPLEKPDRPQTPPRPGHLFTTAQGASTCTAATAFKHAITRRIKQAENCFRRSTLAPLVRRRQVGRDSEALIASGETCCGTHSEVERIRTRQSRVRSMETSTLHTNMVSKR